MNVADLAILVVGLFCLWVIWKVTFFFIKLIFMGLLLALVVVYFQFGM